MLYLDIFIPIILYHCFKSIAEKLCNHCGTTGTISLSLKEPLSAQISHYFTRPIDLLEKVIQAEQFQESQKNLYRKHTESQVR